MPPVMKSLRGLQAPLGHVCVELQNQESQRYNGKLQNMVNMVP
jgi:hypothetical protein